MLGEVKPYRTESSKSPELLGFLQPRNRLFIAEPVGRERFLSDRECFDVRKPLPGPGFMELLLLLPLVSGEIPGFHKLCKDPAGTWKSQDHVQSCHREQDLPGPAVLAQPGAVLVGGIHHTGSSGCKSRLGSVK